MKTEKSEDSNWESVSTIPMAQLYSVSSAFSSHVILLTSYGILDSFVCEFEILHGSANTSISFHRFPQGKHTTVLEDAINIL